MPPTVAQTCARQRDNPVTRRFQTRCSTHQRRLTARRLDSTDLTPADDSNENIQIDPVISHSKKRTVAAPTIAYHKRAKWSHIDLVYCFTRAAF